MGIGNMIGRLLNNESKAEKDERLKTSIEEVSAETKEVNAENNIEQVLSKERYSSSGAVITLCSIGRDNPLTLITKKRKIKIKFIPEALMRFNSISTNTEHLNT